MPKAKAGKGAKTKARSDLDKLAMSDSDNEVDEGLLKVHEGAGADSDGEGGLDDAAVYGLDDSSDSDEGEDDEDDEGDESEDALEEALLKGGRHAALAKQAQFLKQQLRLQQAEDDDDADEDQQQQQQTGARDKLWGASKRAYYQTEDAEIDSDAEAAAAEEEEARQLQAQQAEGMDDDDYGLPGLNAAAAAAEPSLEQQVAAGGRSAAAAAAAAGAAEVETVAVDMEGLTSEQQLAVVLSDAPELLSLLSELRASLAEVRGRVGPVLREVSAGGLVTAAGLSYLEAKHLLLLQYCMCILAYIMIKAEGRPVAGHPVMNRLAQLRLYIEKIRPIDKQLAYQVDKLLRVTAKVHATSGADTAAAAAAAAAAAGEEQQAAAAADGGDALQYRPNPQALISKVPLVGDMAGLDGPSDGVYRPPKLNPVAMPEDRALSNKEMRRVREAQRRAQRSAVMRELAQELAGAPEEVTAELPGMDSASAVAARQRLEARAAAEEELMLRVPLSKTEAKKLRAQRRAGLSGAGLTDFADDVADLVASSTAAEGGRASGLNDLFGKHKLSQKYGADLATEQRAQMRSGDDDIVPRKPLHERRAAFDAVAARRAAAAADAGDGDDYDYDMGGSSGGKKRRQRPEAEEDEFYTAAKAARQSVKSSKAAAHAVPELAPPLAETDASGQRKITYEIEKNRGLTPHRRKDLKNPRKKHRVKFAQAVVRRKGQVQGVKQAPGSARGYAGEATGIKARVAKSTRLG